MYLYIKNKRFHIDYCLLETMGKKQQPRIIVSEVIPSDNTPNQISEKLKSMVKKNNNACK